MRTAFVADVESTSLTPSYGDGSGVIWELALIRYGAPDDPAFRKEYLWRVKPDPSKADEAALAVGRFYERTRDMCTDCKSPRRAYDLTQPMLRNGKPEWSSPAALAKEVAVLLDGATLIAAVPSFDAGFLRAFLNHYGQAATWHYRLRDLGSMAFGYLNGYLRGHPHADILPLDASTDDFAAALGVDLSQFERHSALGDCRLVAACLDVITWSKEETVSLA